MRVLMVLVALVISPFVAANAQGRDAKCKDNSNVRAADSRGNSAAALAAAPGQAKKGCDVAPPPPLVGIHQVHGAVYDDMNGDGQRDMFDDAGLMGWVVELSGTVVRSMTTDASGNFAFIDLPNGSYTVCQVTQGGYQQTAPAACHSFSINQTLGTWVTNINFGNMLLP